MTALAFTPAPPVTAVGVVVPARDEQERIGRCLRSLRRALDHVPDGVDTAVAVVLDRCTDATPQRVAAALSDWPEATILTVPAHCATSACARSSIGSSDILRPGSGC